MLERIRIEKLFGYYDYDIRLNDEKVTILTGPNGYGKTTILRIIKAYADSNFFLFLILKYNTITLSFSGNIDLEIKKINTEPQTSSLPFSDHFNLEIKKINAKPHTRVVFKNLASQEEWYFPDERYQKIFRREGVYHNLRQDEIIFQFLSDYFESPKTNPFLLRGTGIPYTLRRLIAHRSGLLEIRKLSEPHQSFPKYQAYLIKDQRLHSWENSDNFDDQQLTLFETIDAHAKDLEERIIKVSTQYASKAQALESSFPQRLFEEQRQISKEDYLLAIDEITEKLVHPTSSYLAL